MKLLKTVLASAVLATSVGANAAVNGSLGGGIGTFATLSGAGVPNSGGTLSGSVTAVITGGQIQAADLVFADDVVPGENFLSTGPVSGSPTTLTFAGAGSRRRIVGRIRHSRSAALRRRYSPKTTRTGKDARRRQI